MHFVWAISTLVSAHGFREYSGFRGFRLVCIILHTTAYNDTCVYDIYSTMYLKHPMSHHV